MYEISCDLQAKAAKLLLPLLTRKARLVTVQNLSGQQKTTLFFRSSLAWRPCWIYCGCVPPKSEMFAHPNLTPTDFRNMTTCFYSYSSAVCVESLAEFFLAILEKSPVKKEKKDTFDSNIKSSRSAIRERSTNKVTSVISCDSSRGNMIASTLLTYNSYTYIPI